MTTHQGLLNHPKEEPLKPLKELTIEDVERVVREVYEDNKLSQMPYMSPGAQQEFHKAMREYGEQLQQEYVPPRLKARRNYGKSKFHK